MLKRLICAMALSAGFTAAANAQDSFKTADDCLNSVIALQKSAEGKKLSDDKNAKIEDLLTRMEGQCEGEKFTDAAATVSEIKAAIEGK